MPGTPPSFIIGGAPRSGTTWLYEVLDRHPGIFLAKPRQPEPKFFLIDELYRQGLDFYLERWFSDVAPGAVAGEKSTNYLENEFVAHRIADSLPDVKFIFLLREPAVRALSNWRWSRMNGLEELSFGDALSAEDAREKSYPEHQRYSRPHSYFSRGLYARHLTPYLQLFGHQQVLCVRSEDVLGGTQTVLNRIGAYLGVDLRSTESDRVPPINVSEPEPFEKATLESLRQRYEKPNSELERLLGDDFRGWN